MRLVTVGEPGGECRAPTPQRRARPAPLTDLAAASAADAARRAVALVLAGSSPSGLGSADVVYQEFAAPVRYIAVFQSKEATGVGPVTSTQPTDGQTLSVLRPLFGYDGSTPVFTKELDHTQVTDIGKATHASLYSTAGHGVTTSTRAVQRAVRGGGAPPQIFYYRGEGPGSSVLASDHLSRPSSATVTIPGYGTESWAFDSKTGLWTLARAARRSVSPTWSCRRCRTSRRWSTTAPGPRCRAPGSSARAPPGALRQRGRQRHRRAR